MSPQHCCKTELGMFKLASLVIVDKAPDEEEGLEKRESRKCIKTLFLLIHSQTQGQ